MGKYNESSLIGKFTTPLVKNKSVTGKRYLMLHDKGKGEKFKVKVKSSTKQAMKTHRKSSTLSLTLATDEGAWLRQHSSLANREGPHYAGWVRPETGKDG